MHNVQDAKIDISPYDIIVVGSGFCGSVIANLAANDGKRVLVVEKRHHIAGNMYDYRDTNGVLVQKYGPHVFHTNDREVAEYLLSLDEWRNFQFTYAVNLDGETITAPFGFATIDHYYDNASAKEIKDHLLNEYPNQDSVVITELLKNQDPLISSFANLLYEKNYLPYALKQWQLPPSELTEEIIGRMPVRLSDIEPYFQEKYQMLPKHGFTHLFERMLDSPNIDVALNVDAIEHIALNEKRGEIIIDGQVVNVPLVYTGPLENLILGKTGVLPYRSLRIEFEQIEQPSYHDQAVVTYPKEPEYLRTTDYAKFTEDASDQGTTVAFEYPTPYDPDSEYGYEPYYPILTEDSVKANRLLQEKATHYAALIPCGRLADFHYYNMDKAIRRAFEVYETIKQGHRDVS